MSQIRFAVEKNRVLAGWRWTVQRQLLPRGFSQFVVTNPLRCRVNVWKQNNNVFEVHCLRCRNERARTGVEKWENFQKLSIQNTRRFLINFLADIFEEPILVLDVITEIKLLAGLKRKSWFCFNKVPSFSMRTASLQLQLSWCYKS